MSDAGPCPECAAGKHGICDGETWDDELDDVTDCPCDAASHPPVPACPHRCSCTSDQDCPHDCPCDATPSAPTGRTHP